MNLSKKDNNIFFWLFLLIIILAGLYFRLKGLGKWPLTTDEYYLVKSSENILNYGLPKWDAGGYYTRGILQQYLTALLLLFGLKAEFASRIIPVIGNIIAIPGLYLLGKKISGRTLAVILVAVFSFSVWEVEFARFARMYMPFQTIFIWYLYFLYKNIIENHEKSFKWLWILSFLSIFLYEGSIFLSIMNFFPFFWDKEKQTFNPFSININKSLLLKVLISIGILIIAYEFLTFDFRSLFQTNNLPSDIPQKFDYYKPNSSSGAIRKPVLLLFMLPAEPFWLLIFLIPFSASIIVFYSIIKSYSTYLSKISFSTLLFFSLLNLLGLTLISLLIIILIGWLEPKDLKIINSQREDVKWKIFPSRSLKFLIFASSLNFLYWIAFAVKTNVWYKLFPIAEINGTGTAIKTIVKESLNYPYFYETFALFRDTIPIFTFIVLLLFGFLILFILTDYYGEKIIHVRFLLFILFSLLLLVNILNLTYFETRYFFFLYPLVLILVLISVESFSNSIFKNSRLKNISFVISVVIILILSEDFNLNHLLNIDSKEINFRMNFNRPLMFHYYERWDSKTPSEIVNKESTADDIVITNEHTSDFYLNRLDYIFKDYKGVDFRGEAVFNGKKERWTNSKLIYKYSDLNKMIDNSRHRTWLLINTVWASALPELDSLIQKYEKYQYGKGIDSRTILYKIPNQK